MAEEEEDHSVLQLDSELSSRKHLADIDQTCCLISSCAFAEQLTCLVVRVLGGLHVGKNAYNLDRSNVSLRS